MAINSRNRSASYTLSAARYLDVVRGVWAGKFIGGTLGAPVEGWKRRHAFPDQHLPSGIAENDDTDLQILWLHALEEHGVRLNSTHLVSEWREHVRAPWSEYGIAAANWECGVSPPQSGWFNNWYWCNGMGCPIRSEIWGVICPGAPALAANFAAQDGQIDHASDAVEAEKFYAAIEASLFSAVSIESLLDIGLAQIDSRSRLTALVADVREWARASEWPVVREQILARYGHPDATHVLQNVGFTVLGLLAGQGDFGRTMAITLNCGYDADCTAASAGAILGGMLGHSGIPEEYRVAVPPAYKVSEWMRGFPRDGSIEALCVASCHLGLDVAKEWGTGFVLEGSLPPRPPPLPVTAFTVPPPRPPTRRFPTWVVHGPYWRAWDERATADLAAGEHGTPGLPSMLYFTHNQAGFELDPLSGARLSLEEGSPEKTGVGRWVVPATDDRLNLDQVVPDIGPACYYAVAEFRAPTAMRVWLMLGATGPVEVWLNGDRVIHSETYQPLTPTTFSFAASLPAGVNRLVLKLARTSQPLRACVSFKRHTGTHWHQSFYATELEWLPMPN
ncbi:MAG: ADP-ribosylglycohydrolase family protein [Opitutaceae bacterium]|nr:ADP-ribosylglycohydrolase family protein [Opitutaceae bacterium]